MPASQKRPISVVITGGSGFLGSNIVKTLLETHPDWKLTVLDVQSPSPEIEVQLDRFVHADIRSPESVAAAFKGTTPDLVFHTAGIVPAREKRYSTKNSDWERVKAINYDGTRHVLDAALAVGCRRFVYTSSCTVVIDDLEHDYYYMDESVATGLAHLHYGKSKGLAENYVLCPERAAKQGLKACALRPATIIGPGDTAVISLMHDLIAKRETSFIVGDGDNFYDFVYIDNVVQAHVLAGENLLASDSPTAAGKSFFITNLEPVYFWDFLAFVWAQFDHVPPYRVRIPMSLAYMVGFLLEWVTWLTGGVSTLDRGSVKDGVRTWYANCSSAVDILGYNPTVRMSEGVRRSCDFYKEYLAEQAAKEMKKSR